MKGFWIKAVSLLVMVCVLLGYDTVLAAREKNEEIARLSVRVEAMEEYIQASQKTEAGTEAAEEDTYIDGEWAGEAQGFGGPVSVKAIVKEGRITDVEIVSAEKEDQTYLTMAEAMIPKILETQSAEVDTISGATFSSGGIKNAVAQALEKAEKQHGKEK